MSATRKKRVGTSSATWHQLRYAYYAYHEAGHAVVGHWFGRCIAEVALVPNAAAGETFERGKRGWCLFDIFAEAEHEGSLWQPGHRNPTLLAILYAGACASVAACHEHGWQIERWNHGFAQDLVAIEHVLDRIDLSHARRQALKAEQEQLAIDLVLEFWPTVAAVAKARATRQRLQGDEAHRLIQEQLDPGTSDWRTTPRW